jgi:hypothetical protein
MTQAYNLSQLANNLNSSGQLDATDGLVNAVPVANGGTGASTSAGARTNLDVPNTTGSGASGTWGINISGNAATATNATTATTATTANYATTAGNGGVTSVNGGTGAVTTYSLGVDQTWQNVTSSRVSGTTYTNSTNKPIMVVVQGAATSGFTVVINGLTIFSWSNNIQANATFVVPASQSYSVAMPSGINYWCELR